MESDEREVKIGELRTLLREMDDMQLIRFGVRARYLCSKEDEAADGASNQLFINLAEAHAEWSRRWHPDGTDGF
jgi:hypothetical protein